MLVIRRREGEAISMTGGIEVSVLEITPTRVKLGIEAPHTVVVVRKEAVVSAEENRRASSSLSPRQAVSIAEYLRGQDRGGEDAGCGV